jgi:hypothetical protein
MKQIISLSLLALLPVSAHAEIVSFAGSMANSCTLGVGSDGALGLASDGKSLSSQDLGGAQAAITIVSLANNTITVGAPTLAAYPSGYTAGAETTKISYQGAGLLSNVSQDYTTSETSFQVGVIPLTSVVFDSRTENDAGFVEGQYQIDTVITCSP